MKHLFTSLLIIAILMDANLAGAQGMGINTTGAAANSSAMLDVSSNTQGFLPPRMTAGQRTAISTPANGLIVYQTDGTPGLYCNYGSSSVPNWQLIGPITAGVNAGDMAYWNGTSWVQLAGGTSGQVLTFCSGVPKWTTGGTCPITIGSSYGGGIVFYVDGTGAHGLIAATSDQSSGIPWNNGSNILIGASSTDGAVNTAAIIAAQGSGTYAASLAHSYTGGGYTDWYLPSENELNLLTAQASIVGGFLNTYWSSTEYSVLPTYDAVFQYLPGGAEGGVRSKYTYFAVRAIRAF
jgi:hypothetical protein